MERLTKYTPEGCLVFRGRTDGFLKKLAKYEDTGLTPEEISTLKMQVTELERAIKESAKLYGENAFCNTCINRDKPIEKCCSCENYCNWQFNYERFTGGERE